MQGFFKFLSAVMFAVAVLGFIGLGVYFLFFEESGRMVGVIGDGSAAGDALNQSTRVIDDVLSEQPGQQNRILEDYAYKKEESETDPLTILLYILGGIVGLYALKKMVQFWNYLVKNSV